MGGWNQKLVPWDEVVFDVIGIVGDLVPHLQIPVTLGEGIKYVSDISGGWELISNTAEIINKYPNNLKGVDWGNIVLDTVSLFPELGIVGSIAGLPYNLSKGILWEEKTIYP
jgi:hypothetical protein